VNTNTKGFEQATRDLEENMKNQFNVRDKSFDATPGHLIFVLFSLVVMVFGGVRTPVYAAPLSRETGESRESKPKVLLELFTSQGCSSCPKADALLPTFIARKDVIAVSMPIDYWDYLGWRDTFGQAIFTARQRSYGKKIGGGIVYTPQIVIDGRYHMNGADEKAIAAMIEQRKKAKARHPGVALDVKTKDGMLLVSVGRSPKDSAIKKATLWMALFSKEKAVKIKRGENRGRSLVYHNIVRELTPIGHWSGEEMVLKLPKKQIMQRGADGCVILLQKGDGGPIVAAAQMPRW
jgi:hypothetical protein